MVEAFPLILMVLNTKESGKIIRNRVEGFLLLAMALITMENGSKVRHTELVNLLTLMELCTRESGVMVSNMVKAFSLSLRMVTPFTLDIGNKVRGTAEVLRL